jgi:hypothetical protein
VDLGLNKERVYLAIQEGTKQAILQSIQGSTINDCDKVVSAIQTGVYMALQGIALWSQKGRGSTPP